MRCVRHPPERYGLTAVSAARRRIHCHQVDASTLHDEREREFRRPNLAHADRVLANALRRVPAEAAPSVWVTYESCWWYRSFSPFKLRKWQTRAGKGAL